MSASHENETSHPEIDVLLAEYLERVDAGETVDRGEFLREHPEWAGELQELLEAGDAIELIAKPPAGETASPAAFEGTRDFLAGAGVAGEATPDIHQEETWSPGETGESANDPAPPVGTTVPSDRRALPQGQRFGDYELLDEIARGGMGIVYKARQVKLDRIVALKMILSGQFASESEVARFYVEAKTAAAIHHPHIVPVHDVGEEDGQHYLSMGFVEGESLAARLGRGPLPPSEGANLVRKLADAISAAHAQGVIHRDLKPANILLEKNGEPYITDFGLAKQTGSDNNLTARGLVLGTPYYMSPEQAAGKSEEVGPLSDVYALGAILYCVLTGRPPFLGESVAETIHLVRMQKPDSPRLLNPEIPPELVSICMKSLEKEPRDRFADASELSEELKQFLLRKHRRLRADSSQVLKVTCPGCGFSLFVKNRLLLGLPARCPECRLKFVLQEDVGSDFPTGSNAEREALEQQTLASREFHIAQGRVCVALEQVEEWHTSEESERFERWIRRKTAVQTPDGFAFFLEHYDEWLRSGMPDGK